MTRAAAPHRRPAWSWPIGLGCVLVWTLAPCVAQSAELSARAWVEPESPRIGERAYLVLQADLLSQSPVMAVGPVRVELPEVPELGLGPHSVPLSQSSQTILSGGRATVRSEQRVPLHAQRPGRYEIPAIAVSARVGQEILNASAAPVFVEVSAGEAAGDSAMSGAPSASDSGSRGRLLLVVAVALAGLALLAVVVAVLARGLARGAKPQPSSPDPRGEDLVQRLTALAGAGDPTALMDYCLSHLRSLIGDEARTMTRTEIEQALEPRLSEGCQGRLRELLDTVEAVCFAGAQPDAEAMERAALDTITVSRELGGLAPQQPH